MKKPTHILCMRVEDATPATRPIGSSVIECSECGLACVISPASFKWIRRGAEAVCLPCCKDRSGDTIYITRETLKEAQRTTQALPNRGSGWGSA